MVGIAPMADDCGPSRGRRCIRGGRFDVYRVLHMAALSASRHNPVLDGSRGRLIAAGTLPAVALAVCTRKLLTTLDAMVRTSTPRDNSFHGA